MITTAHFMGKLTLHSIAPYCGGCTSPAFSCRDRRICDVRLANMDVKFMVHTFLTARGGLKHQPCERRSRADACRRLNLLMMEMSID
jgi:hypothetical protein